MVSEGVMIFNVVVICSFGVTTLILALLIRLCGPKSKPPQSNYSDESRDSTRKCVEQVVGVLPRETNMALPKECPIEQMPSPAPALETSRPSSEQRVENVALDLNLAQTYTCTVLTLEEVSKVQPIANEASIQIPNSVSKISSLASTSNKEQQPYKQEIHVDCSDSVESVYGPETNDDEGEDASSDVRDSIIITDSSVVHLSGPEEGKVAQTKRVKKKLKLFSKKKTPKTNESDSLVEDGSAKKSVKSSKLSLKWPKRKRDSSTPEPIKRVSVCETEATFPVNDPY